LELGDGVAIPQDVDLPSGRIAAAGENPVHSVPCLHKHPFATQSRVCTCVACPGR
jgi:hypothetical protein